MDHSPGFLALVNDAKKRVTELSVAETRARLAANPKAILLDVREDHEWNAGHVTEAVHLGFPAEELLALISERLTRFQFPEPVGSP